MRYFLKNDIERAFLYRLYWKLITEDILKKLGCGSSKEEKQILHSFHKRVLKYDSIAGKSANIISLFISEVILFWAERGIFVRSSSKQKWGMEDKPLSKLWSKL